MNCRIAGRNSTLLVLAALFVAAPLRPEAESPRGEPARRARYVMGTIFEITAYGSERGATVEAIEAAFAAIRKSDRALSHYRKDSDLERLNRLGFQEPVVTPPELFAVLEHSIRLDRLSGGAFDVTIGPLVDLWRRAAERNSPPTEREIRDAKALVGSRRVELLAGSRARFTKQGVSVNLGGIGKGWAIDQAATVLRRHGIQDALLNAGTSTIFAMGDERKNEGWVVGIRDPRRPSSPPAAVARLHDEAVSTSANYELHFEIAGRRYSHIIDPRNGRPIERMLSASVVAPAAVEADALSTAFCVLGMREAETLLRRVGYAGLLIGRREASSPIATRMVPREDGKDVFFRDEGR